MLTWSSLLQDTFEIQEGSIPQGATVVIIDDLIVSSPSLVWPFEPQY